MISINLSTSITSRLAGNGTVAGNSDGDALTVATLNDPYGIAYDSVTQTAWFTEMVGCT